MTFTKELTKKEITALNATDKKAYESWVMSQATTKEVSLIDESTRLTAEGSEATSTLFQFNGDKKDFFKKAKESMRSSFLTPSKCVVIGKIKEITNNLIRTGNSQRTGLAYEMLTSAYNIEMLQAANWSQLERDSEGQITESFQVDEIIPKNTILNLNLMASLGDLTGKYVALSRNSDNYLEARVVSIDSNDIKELKDLTIVEPSTVSENEN